MTYINLVLENSKIIVRKILQYIKDFVNGLLQRNVKQVEVDIRKLVEDAIKRQPEYKSLLGGKLQSQLGVTHPQQRLDEIVRVVVDSIEVKVNKLKETGGQLTGGLEIQFVKTKFADLLKSPAASYVTDKGVKIEWLRWLLLEGDKLIVRSYTIGVDPKNYARTRLGEIMINTPKKQGGWSVPSEFAGTAENNFITRALVEVYSDIGKILEGAVRAN